MPPIGKDTKVMIVAESRVLRPSRDVAACFQLHMTLIRNPDNRSERDSLAGRPNSSRLLVFRPILLGRIGLVCRQLRRHFLSFIEA